jgi:hypothetical protein
VKLGDGETLESSSKSGSEYTVKTPHYFFSYELGMFLVHSCKARKLSWCPGEILSVLIVLWLTCAVIDTVFLFKSAESICGYFVISSMCYACLHRDFSFPGGMDMVGIVIFVLPLSGDIWSMPVTLDNFFDILVLGAFYVIVGTVNCFSHSRPSRLDAID